MQATVRFIVLQNVTLYAVPEIYQHFRGTSSPPPTPLGYINSFAVFMFRGKGFVNFCQTNVRQTVIFFFVILQSLLRTLDCANLLFLVYEKTLYLVLCTKGELNIFIG